MDEINAVQYEIFKAFHAVCVEHNLTYYLVHGSLLGALKYNGFFPLDDDIDVAMPRKDYEFLIRNGQQYFDNKYFIQSYLSEKEYPLTFAKIRDNDTAFIQPVLKACRINKGIYIDVFPIDNYPKNILYQKYLKLKQRILSSRVNVILFSNSTLSIKSHFIQLILKLIFPSWEMARNRLCCLYNSMAYTGKVVVRGGKPVEEGMPYDMWGSPQGVLFEDIPSFAPRKMDSYLELIYGDYLNYEPMGKYKVSEDEVVISADTVDVRRSYKEYLE